MPDPNIVITKNKKNIIKKKPNNKNKDIEKLKKNKSMGPNHIKTFADTSTNIINNTIQKVVELKVEKHLERVMETDFTESIKDRSKRTRDTEEIKNLKHKALII